MVVGIEGNISFPDKLGEVGVLDIFGFFLGFCDVGWGLAGFNCAPSDGFPWFDFPAVPDGVFAVNAVLDFRGIPAEFGNGCSEFNEFFWGEIKFWSSDFDDTDGDAIPAGIEAIASVFVSAIAIAGDGVEVAPFSEFGGNGVNKASVVDGSNGEILMTDFIVSIDNGTFVIGSWLNGILL